MGKDDVSLEESDPALKKINLEAEIKKLETDIDTFNKRIDLFNKKSGMTRIEVFKRKYEKMINATKKDRKRVNDLIKKKKEELENAKNLLK